MEHSIVGLMVTDELGTVLFANPRAAAFLGRGADAMVGAVSPLDTRSGQRQVDRAGNGLALLFVDLDRFKQVNDRFGHDAGDALIRAVAARISECMRADDLVARLGGDEFAVAMRLEHADDAGRVAHKILRALQSPLQIGGQEIAARASIGIATYPNDAGDADALVKAADTAM